MAKFIDRRPSTLRLFWSFPGWFGLIFLVAGLGVEIGAVAFGVSALRLANDGVETVGQVLGKDWRESTDSDGDRSVSYYVRFRFETGAGARIEDEASVKRAMYDRVGPGDTVPVRYWPDDPMLNEIEPGSRQVMVVMMGVLGLPFSLVGGFFVWRQARFARRAVRLREHGERRDATVLEHVATAFKVNNRRQYALKWRDGRGNIGQSRPTGAARLEAFPPGSTITVYAGAAQPGVTVWEGDVGQPGRGYGRARREATGDLPDRDARQEGREPTVRRR